MLSLNFLSCAALWCVRLLLGFLGVDDPLLWKLSIVKIPYCWNDYKDQTCFCSCLQAFLRLAIPVRECSVIVDTQRPLQMHTTNSFQLLLVYLAIGRLIQPCWCSCAVVLSSQLEQQAMWQPRLDSFWPFWIRKNHKTSAAMLWRLPAFVICFQSVIVSFIVCLLFFAIVCVVVFLADTMLLWGNSDHFDCASSDVSAQCHILLSLAVCLTMRTAIFIQTRLICPPLRLVGLPACIAKVVGCHMSSMWFIEHGSLWFTWAGGSQLAMSATPWLAACFLVVHLLVCLSAMKDCDTDITSSTERHWVIRTFCNCSFRSLFSVLCCSCKPLCKNKSTSWEWENTCQNAGGEACFLLSTFQESPLNRPYACRCKTAVKQSSWA